jgi:mannose-6-phosphate isomerase-like protein (cupin superfamily)
MPKIKIGEDKFPEWSEIKDIQLIKLSAGEKKIIESESPKTALFIEDGKCSIGTEHSMKEYSAGEKFYDASSFFISAHSAVKLILIEGRWGDKIGTSDFFVMDNSRSPVNTGDPAAYDRKTEFDNHYHDFDEVWIILEGEMLAYSEGKPYRLGPGDCLLTPMGFHHDMTEIYKKIKGIYFETTLKGKKRLGHLWIHTHGTPQKHPEVKYDK